MWITYAAIYFLAMKVFKNPQSCGRADAHRVALPNYAARLVCRFWAACCEGFTTALSVRPVACGSVLMTPFCLLIPSGKSAR